ncbi:MAG: hypothetical protein ABI443_04355 [Chthoniobacterales bacterium]
MKPFLFFAFFLLPFSLIRVEAGEPSPFTIEIVPSGGGKTIQIENENAAEFYVVLTNISKKSQNVWEYWNSWGYYNLSFKFTLKDGKSFKIVRRPHSFRRNFPSVYLIPPGEHQVYAIRLDKEWEITPEFSLKGETPVTFKVIYDTYEIPVEPEMLKYNIWMGRLESKEYQLDLYP